MNLKITIAAVVLIAALSGCKSVPTPGDYSASPKQAAAHGPSHGASAPPGVFDYYVFNLSWSPEFCATHISSPECAARPGFIVHGLWPQNNNGTYPENCDNPTLPTNPSEYLTLMPTIGLIEHEWKTHGTCSGLDPASYFADVRSALEQIEIPPIFAALHYPPASIAPNALLDDFRRVNPAFPRSGFAISCGHNYLTAVEICFDKNLHPIACRAIRTCRANVIKITPR